MGRKKRGISPVIATTLLIALVIIIFVIVFMWFRSTLKPAILKFGENIELACEKVSFSADYSNGKLTHRWEPVVIKDVVSFCIDANSKRPDEVEKEAFDKFGVDVKGKIVTIRVEGMLREGKPSDINFREIFSRLYDNGAHCVLRNINKLTSKEFEELMVEAGNVDRELAAQNNLTHVTCETHPRNIVLAMLSSQQHI